MRNDASLTSGVRRMPRCPTQASGRTHGAAARRTSLRHRDLTPRPCAGVLNGFTWSWVVRSSRLELVKHVLRAGRGPQGKEVVIRVRERPAASYRHEAWIANLRKDHWLGAGSVLDL